MFQKLFTEKDLDIIVQCNLKITNYINIILNFNDGSYHPYRKPNKGINYMHVNSDHPKQSKQSKQKENLTLFGSIHHTASSLKLILAEYSSN